MMALDVNIGEKRGIVRGEYDTRCLGVVFHLSVSLGGCVLPISVCWWGPPMFFFFMSPSTYI